MPCDCKGICPRYIAMGKSWFGPHEKPYAYCTHCKIPTDWRGATCPCCGTRLRHKSRSSKSRNQRVAIAPRVS